MSDLFLRDQFSPAPAGDDYLVVRETRRYAARQMNNDKFELAKSDLRIAVERQLPEGYGEAHGDYAQIVTRFIDGSVEITYEVYL